MDELIIGNTLRGSLGHVQFSRAFKKMPLTSSLAQPVDERSVRGSRHTS